MQSEDWRDALGALAAMMPDTPDENIASAESDLDHSPAPQSDRLRIVVERKGRAGKTATIICGFTIADDEIEKIASDLKRAIGCGGSARGGEILLQGDRARMAQKILSEAGFKFKGQY